MNAIHFVMKFTIARLNDDYVNATCRMDDGCRKMAVDLFIAFLHCDGACAKALHRNNTGRHDTIRRNTDKGINAMTARPR
jgi:hypothetical protein